MEVENADDANLQLARKWCETRGPGWSIRDTAGRGGTAPVFTVDTPDGARALKLYDAKFSEGDLGRESEARLKPQLDLGLHSCLNLVRVHDGGRFEERLFILMDRAEGQELEKRLAEVPREKIRKIIGQLANAAIFLRDRGLCHRDIKSANIFITDDFEKITLLDLSVLRDVHDPVGLGTDHGGELPVVATSRYSPPEYLFRLISPDINLWHALDIYQIGGVLHDLIMREPMFEREYRLTRDTNRYRFAWIVATQDPEVQAADVDFDLVLLARRALDKDWQRRSQLQLEDFTDDAIVRKSAGLEILGLAARAAPSGSSRATVNKWMSQLSEVVETEIVTRLRGLGITAHHETKKVAQDEERLLSFSWELPEVGAPSLVSKVCLDVHIRRVEGGNGATVLGRTTLHGVVGGHDRTVSLDLPSIAGGGGEPPFVEVVAAVFGVLGDLGSMLMRAT